MRRINRKDKAQNGGFTLVELIICMAIIVIMSGIAMVTVTLINSARAKEAAVTLESSLSDMISKSKSQVCVVAGVEQPRYQRCLKVYLDGTSYYVQSGYYNPDGTDDATKYIFPADENVNQGKGISMSSRVSVRYTGEDGVEKKISGTDDAGNVKQVYIIYNNAGRCISGYGTFSFYKRNGNKIAAVTIQKNGSHQSN